jgi:hypothetical protein
MESKKSNQTIVVPVGNHSPVKIYPETKRIINWNGRYHLGLETKDFIFFINYQEGDENSCIIMYRKQSMGLASDNYFGYSAIFEILTERENEITYISPTMKYNLKLHKEAFPEMHKKK